MDNTKVVVRFSANPWPLSWAIRFRTWSKYSHVDFVVGDGHYLGALPFTGVCRHTHNYPTEDYFVLDVTPEQHKEIMDRALAQIGKPYDFKGLFGYAFKRNWQEDDSWFCSEYVSGVIQPTIKLFNEEPRKISPRDLSIHGAFRKVDYATVKTLFA